VNLTVEGEGVADGIGKAGGVERTLGVTVL
jgi:hypothetical protein